MLWEGRRESSNVEDRRGISGGGLLAGGGILGVIALIVNFFLSGGDVSQLPQSLPTGGGQQQTSAPVDPAQDTLGRFVKTVLADTEDIWGQIFKQSGAQYTDPTLVLFSGSVQSGCGGATSQSGPFYCPGDGKLYIDLSFYQELRDRFQAPGNFAMAYVIAHEIGHHVQDLMGTSEKMQRLRSQLSETEYNRYSVMLELQADFYAGVWAHYEKNLKTADGRNVVQAEDIPAALTAANAIGDDRLQKESQGYVVPDAFTHGTSAQRVYWFKKGFETGDIKQGDTFSDPSLR